MKKNNTFNVEKWIRKSLKKLNKDCAPKVDCEKFCACFNKPVAKATKTKGK